MWQKLLLIVVQHVLTSPQAIKAFFEGLRSLVRKKDCPPKDS